MKYLLLLVLLAGCAATDAAHPEPDFVVTETKAASKTCDCTPCRCNPCKCSPNQPAEVATIEPTPDPISTPPVGEVYYGVDGQWHYIHADTKKHVTYKRLSCSRQGCTWGWK